VCRFRAAGPGDLSNEGFRVGLEMEELNRLQARLTRKPLAELGIIAGRQARDSNGVVWTAAETVFHLWSRRRGPPVFFSTPLAVQIGQAGLLLSKVLPHIGRMFAGWYRLDSDDFNGPFDA